jgi:putative sterol carrier protein
MADITAKQIMDGMVANFLPDKATGVAAVVQLHLTGAGGGDYYLTIGEGKIALAEGNAPTPRLTLTSSVEDFAAIVTGKLDGMAAFSQGKLKLAGDLGLSMKLMSFFKRA